LDRPLPEELLDYARSDTHFLLYVFDKLRNELIEKSDFSDPAQDKIQTVLENSQTTALQRYENPVYDALRGSGPVGWYRQLFKGPITLFSREQFAVFRAVHQWRDTIARQEDEGLHHVMANHVISSIARQMPTEKPALFSAVQPMSQFVRLRIDELLGVVVNAKAEGVNGPTMEDMLITKAPAGEAPPVLNTVADFAAAARAATAPKPVAPATAAVAARQPVSAFWGPALGGNARQRPRFTFSDGISLALPLPPLTAQVFADPNAAELKQQQPVDPAARAEHAYVKASDRPKREEMEDVFVLSDNKRKRKAANAEAELHADDGPGFDGQSDEVAVPDPDVVEAQQRAMEKAQRKVERKAAKRAKQEQEAMEAGAVNGGEEEEAFDYENAPSVLHAPREDVRETAKRGLNPYKKSLDAPKGLGRKVKEMPGKSKTFRK